MSVFTRRVIAAGLALAVLGSASLAEHYQCRNPTGCIATRTKKGKTQTVLFRKGDLVSTGSGWTVDPADGWVKLRGGVGPGS